IHNWFVYDVQGLLRATLDGEGDLTRYNYDGQGHLEQTIAGQVIPPPTLIGTRPLLASLPAAAGGTVLDQTSYVRDTLGRITSETRTLSGGATETDAFSYDAMTGKLISETTDQGLPDARTSTYTYDVLGRMTGEVGGVGSAQFGGSLTNAQVYAQY